jgi:hypothetical protein
LSLKVIENRLNQLQRKKIENKLKSNQYLAIECVVARGIPLAMLNFPMVNLVYLVYLSKDTKVIPGIPWYGYSGYT